MMTIIILFHIYNVTYNCSCTVIKEHGNLSGAVLEYAVPVTGLSIFFDYFAQEGLLFFLHSY